MNLVKALKEIDTLDIQQLEKLLALSHGIKQQEMAQEQHSATMAAGQANESAPKQITQPGV